MNDEVVSAKPDTEQALYWGAAAAAFVSLLPYVNLFLVPAYIAGAFTATRYASRRRQQFLTPKQGAKLGFLSTFFGTLAAGVIVDVIWQFFDFQLWQKENAALLLAIFRMFASPSTIDLMSLSMAQNASKPFAWYVIVLQVIVGGIFAGIFGSIFGLLGAKIFRPKADARLAAAA